MSVDDLRRAEEGVEVSVSLVGAVANLSEDAKSALRGHLMEERRSRWDWVSCILYYSEKYAALSDPLDSTADAVIGQCGSYARAMAIAEREIHYIDPLIHEELGDHSLNGILGEGRRLSKAKTAEIRSLK